LNKKKYKDNLKEIGKNTLNDLEPVIKKGCSDILNFVNEVVCDTISYLFNKPKSKSK